MGKTIPGLIVPEVIEADIHFTFFLNLGHNSSIVTKIIETFAENLKDGINIFPEEPHPET